VCSIRWNFTRVKRRYDNQSLQKTLVLEPTMRSARAGIQSAIHPKLTGRRRAHATYRAHGPRRRLVTIAIYCHLLAVTT
jgi:hypothetical protein